jgi:hypothetical protein
MDILYIAIFLYYDYLYTKLLIIGSSEPRYVNLKAVRFQR